MKTDNQVNQISFEDFLFGMSSFTGKNMAVNFESKSISLSPVLLENFRVIIPNSTSVEIQGGNLPIINFTKDNIEYITVQDETFEILFSDGIKLSIFEDIDEPIECDICEGIIYPNENKYIINQFVGYGSKYDGILNSLNKTICTKCMDDIYDAHKGGECDE